MTESNPEEEEQTTNEQEASLKTSTSEESPKYPAPDLTVEPNKRLSEAEPEELVQALRQVFNGNDEKPQTKAFPTTGAQLVPAEAGPEQTKAGQSKISKKTAAPPEAKSGYTNPFALFADVFYGVLIAPSPTFSILSDCSKFPPSPGNLFLTCILVILALALPAAVKVGFEAGSALGLLKAGAFIFGNLVNWAILSFVLYYLSIWLRGNRLTLGNAFIVTGWAYLPFAFFAPVACFKNALGNGFTLFACGPALWFIVLQWLAFQTALRTTTIKLALIALVVPPIFCLVYLFWIGLAVFSLLSQLLSHLT